MSKPDDGKKTRNKGAVSALEEMGIKNPSEISRYTLWQEDEEDVLRVYYKRGKGSLRPSSHKYRFGRTHKTIVTDSGKPTYAQGGELSPFLEKALAELDEIVRNSNDHDVLKAALIDELDHLEKYVSSRIRELRAQAEQL